MNKLLAAAVLCLAASTSIAGTKHSTETKYPSYEGLVMAGYQGWFHKPYKGGKMYANEKDVRIDMWPDVSEYEQTYETGLKHADGSTDHCGTMAVAHVVLNDQHRADAALFRTYHRAQICIKNVSSFHFLIPLEFFVYCEYFHFFSRYTDGAKTLQGHLKPELLQ